MMHMTFYWSRQVTLLFSSWRTESWLSYALTLLACVLASALYQYLEHVRYQVRRGGKPAEGTAEEPLLLQQKGAGSGNRGKWSVKKVVGGVLFGLSSALGYLLMLAIMSFNGGVFLAIVLGLTVGFLVSRNEEDDQIAGVNSTCACA
ncbi:Ctr copper transporter - like 3 [Theobroma cacao]|uniref:Copper transport protein n=1 Tax=Theobroma cacao TaxID=3641 RepID=A0AB32WZ80_THECC|nr:PREDICTED: copper transporter 5.1 [Theobroma cacao]WRX31544.1 Ctr copper transporter - like 3 [Theobroma cacao]